jgi:hypothetical protein
MRTTSFFLIFFMSFFSLLTGYSFAETNPDECLVIGMDANPAQGRKMFKKALDARLKGKTSDAVEYYERAIIADHSILKHEDHGLAMKLLEKYRDFNATQTPALLCKRAFLENILIGNMEDSIKFYEEAAEVAKNDDVTALAREEAQRLELQLEYLRNWQAQVQRQNEIERRKDLERYLQRSKIKELEGEVEDNSFELEELQERLAYLQEQEEKVREEMYDSVETAARYRRRYYYPGAYQSPTPEPSQNNVPPGEWGSDGSDNTQQVPNPYGNQQSSSKSRYRYRYYAHRGSARRHQEKLSQIRAEISGVQRRIAQIKKESKELRQELSDEAVRDPNSQTD